MRHRHVYCHSMADLRGEFLSEQDIAHYQNIGSMALANMGVTMIRDLPEIPKVEVTEEDQQILFDDKPLKFAGHTYVDGSLVPVRVAPSAGRAGYSVVCMEDMPYDSEEDESERPD